MLTMHCPSCGAAGRVPDEKINARLHCKKCLTVFHLTPLGNPVPGPPPTTPDEMEPVRRKLDHDDEVDQWIATIKDLPRRLIKPAAAAAALFVIYATYQYVLPTSINTRATQAALALTNPDPRPLQDLSLPGTGAATQKWHAGVRSRHKDFPGGGVKPKVQILSVNRDSARGLAEVTAIISEPDVISRASLSSPNAMLDYASGERAVEVRIVLSGGALTGWRVDGSRSLESFQQSVSSELVKTGKE